MPPACETNTEKLKAFDGDLTKENFLACMSGSSEQEIDPSNPVVGLDYYES